MRFSTIVLVVILNIFTLNAQNLVQNWSFEDTIPCSIYSNVYASTDQLRPYHWFTPSYGSPDFFDTNQNCAWGGGIPSNIFGSQMPKSGNAMIGFGLYHSWTSWSFREYISSMMIDSLISGHKYCVQFFISLADNSTHAINRVGMYFSTDSISNPGTGPLPYIPQIEHPNNTFLTDTMNWIPITGEYIAYGGEQYITIGNFYDDANTDTLNTNTGSGANGTYYFIDDIYIEDCTLNSFGDIVNASFNIYPNPFNEKINIKISSKSRYELILYDLSFRILNRYNFEGSLSIPASNLENGTYFIELKNNLVNSKIYKIIKI